MTHEWIDQPEGRLRVTKAGDHGSPVVLLSGAGMDNAHLSWARLLPELARDHRVYALDWPKQGRSRPWRGIADHPVMLRCVLAVLDQARLERADLVGLSQGGALALATAIDSPERVRRLVAMAPAGIISFPPPVHQLLWLIAKVPFLNSTMWTRLFRRRSAMEAFVRRFLFAGPVDDFDAVVDEVMVEMDRTGGVTSSDWQNNSINFTSMTVDLRPQLCRISCPTLFIQGDKDVGVAPKHTRAAASLVPGARLEMIEGAGHWVQRQEPERVNRLVREFLAG
ncbi:alpha/beta fold hydrolase [Microlunatus sp. Y2014]|uniref:alpha/beta fold hydrolase n=1 Tax=Microlunatus sp. Y2014 TaxID=3418488 RepID=UPI003DA74441